jgi:hypothetical protein
VERLRVKCDRNLTMSQAKALKLVAENRARELSDNAPAIRAELRRISQRASFHASHRSRLFLGFVVERALAGRLDELKERVIGSLLFGSALCCSAGPPIMIQGRIRLSGWLRMKLGGVCTLTMLNRRTMDPFGSSFPQDLICPKSITEHQLSINRMRRLRASRQCYPSPPKHPRTR